MKKSSEESSPAGRFAAGDAPGMLAGTRVIEVGDETGDYCGLLLAGLGAEVIKVEPPGGAPSRRIGPYYQDRPDPEGSLFFWQYNRAKRSVVLDLASAEGRAGLRRLVSGADVLLDSSCGDANRALDLGREQLRAAFPGLVVARLTPFGDEGPWKDYKASDLVHLALGGVMMNCGYDPDPAERYDLPPIAPQMWHASHIAGEHLLIAILAALLNRARTGAGQDVSCAVHQAVSVATELDIMSWVMRRATLYRQTCRHSTEARSRTPNISHTKDGRWYITWLIGARDEANLVPFLERYGMAADLQRPAADSDFKARDVPGSSPTDERKAHILEVVQRFVRSYRYDDVPWNEAQDAGLLWAPLRKPHENASDEHWLARRSFSEVAHPELGRSFTYATSKWLSTETSWQTGRRAPRLGEDTKEVLSSVTKRNEIVKENAGHASRLSPRGKPFPLQGVRIFDFSWFLASAGGTRCAAALGAEVIKVEWKGNPDTRLGAMAPVGGRAARAAATGPLPGVTDAEMGGQFNNKNTGKRGLSLNVRHPEGLAIAKALIKMSDVVAEGFSPGVLERIGLGYDVLRSIRPDIIYVQQSGMGSQGRYGRMRTVGPIAQAFSGSSEMSGLPEPAMPAGWGYSYLDWMGAYGFAQAILGALYYRERTGKGQWIDSSQCEGGLFIGGTAVLDWSANGRVWQRYGNRSPYKAAAPHGAYRCAGDDRWIAIACFDEGAWTRLAKAAGHPEWVADPRFATLEARLAHQDALDALVQLWTATQEAHACMERLQAAGVPAGVCQSAGDRCEADPQLAALQWMTEVNGTRIGTWPIPEFPVKLADTPAHAGGATNRGAPNYGEDNEYILGELLGMSGAEIKRLAGEGVI